MTNRSSNSQEERPGLANPDLAFFKRMCFLKIRGHIYILTLIGLIVTLLLFGPAAHAQQAGHYIPGITGLENGSTPPPGLFVSYLPYINPIDAIKGPEGATVEKPDINLVANNVIYTVTTPKKILGADYGLNFIIPVVNTRFTSNLFDASAQTAGVSDIYFAPIVLGWEKGQANFTVNYGFYAPTGAFDPSSPLNPGLGFWEQQIQAGTTYALDKKKLWNTSILTTWEINQSKSGLDLKPGPMFTGEYSFGRRFFKYQMNAGVTGYIYHKLSADSGADVNPLVAGDLDRSFGIGPEWKYTNLRHHLGFDVRYQEQFGVQSKTSGRIFVVGITFLNLLPPKPKK